MDRKLASIRKVDAIEPIEGADKIVIAKLDGWQVVTQKDWCKPGDLVCYFEVDSFLPVRPEYEFLRKSGYKNTKNLGEGFRLKTIKLRKQLSQGLIMPLMEVLSAVDHPPTAHVEGADLTEILGVKLYEKPIPAQLAGRVKGNFPMWIRKTDQERAQNLTKYLPKYLDSWFEATMKLDGSSMTVYIQEEILFNEEEGEYSSDIVGVCSRNYDLAEEAADGRRSAFWKCARDNELIDKLKAIKQDTGRNLALQGELMGPGVQDNRENFIDYEFFCFDIWDIDQQKYLLPKERLDILVAYDILHAPLIGNFKLKDICLTEDIIGHLLKFADRPSLNIDVPLEGIVFKSHEEPRFSFKIINNNFLLQEKD
jgi:RNA ligase (TIGR02306 family)